MVRKRRTTKEPVLTKLDYWAIAANEVYKACRKNGMDESTALAFAMDRIKLSRLDSRYNRSYKRSPRRL
jgi:hypothetical protein